MKLNLGCGSQVPDGWVNVDYALGARFMKLPFFRKLNKKVNFFNMDWNEKIFLHDLSSKFPWEDSSVKVVYSSHTLEHFSKVNGRKFLAECYRVLSQKGIIRIVVPDLRALAAEYIDGRLKADDFMEKLGCINDVDNKGFKRLYSSFFQFSQHKCMYDNSSLIKTLNEIGFEVSNRVVFDSDIEDIRQIELENRTIESIIVEGRKR